MSQNTLAERCEVSGTGLHTGACSRVLLHPAEPNSGRSFLVAGVRIPARADHVVDTRRCTVLGHEGARVATVEHLLSAMYALEIDNAIIEIDGHEVPILDGSALPFVEMLTCAGVAAQPGEPRRVRVTEPLTVQTGGSDASIEAATRLELDVEVQFDEWPQGDCRTTVRLEAAHYAAQIAPARTFAFLHEVEALRAAGLARGGSLDNALVIDPPDRFSSPLRLPCEWLVHKTLDLIGDLALVDARIEARIVARRPGHTCNCRAALQLLEQARIATQGGAHGTDA